MVFSNCSISFDYRITVFKSIDPDWEDKVDSGIGLSYPRG
jgi:hypothetical protein